MNRSQTFRLSRMGHGGSNTLRSPAAAEKQPPDFVKNPPERDSGKHADGCRETGCNHRKDSAGPAAERPSIPRTQTLAEPLITWGSRDQPPRITTLHNVTFCGNLS